MASPSDRTSSIDAQRASSGGEQAAAHNRSSWSRARIRRSLLVVIVGLYVLSIPWYRDDPGELRLVVGLPDWVATALICYVVVALLNSVAWLLTDIEDPAPAQRHAERAPDDPAGGAPA